MLSQDFVNNKQKDCLAYQVWSSHQNRVSSLDKVFPNDYKITSYGDKIPSISLEQKSMAKKIDLGKRNS